MPVCRVQVRREIRGPDALSCVKCGTRYFVIDHLDNIAVDRPFFYVLFVPFLYEGWLLGIIYTPQEQNKARIPAWLLWFAVSYSFSRDVFTLHTRLIVEGAKSTTNYTTS